MRYAVALFSSILLLQVPALASSDTVVDDLSHHPMVAEFPSGGQLDLRIRSAEVHIVGSDEDKIRVLVEGRGGSESTDMKASFERTDRYGKLRVSGGPSSNVTITIQVPKKSDLSIHIFAGDVEVKDITGNKDVDLSAGDLTISVGNAADYSHVEASVSSGSIEAGPFGESRGGLFRSFERFGNGKYKLAAHVGAGDLTLK